MLVASAGLDKQLSTEPEECASADFDWRDSNDRMTPDSVSGREAPLDLGRGRGCPWFWTTASGPVPFSVKFLMQHFEYLYHSVHM